MTTRFAMRALISLSMISCYRSGHPYRPDDCHRREKHIRQQNAYWFLGALRMIRNADTGNREFETDTSGDFFMSEHYEKNGAAVLEDDGRICDGSFCLCPTLPLAETTSLYWSPFCQPQLKFDLRDSVLHLKVDATLQAYSAYMDEPNVRFVLDVQPQGWMSSDILVLWNHAKCSGTDCSIDKWKLECPREKPKPSR
eukprot:TRINITY_DN27510_c0_g1_i2.p1 TRINITY_DN27510_c0_g1~~TRINITY_DN27510_c0_g1_i2.p1  ORF type:complete len:197 (-),score=16.62 TRINITY_DN27510_c0_g1_i2:704-1294(-)